MTATMEPSAKVTSPRLDSKVPQTDDIANMWENHKFSMKLVNPSNKRKFNVIVVGTGLAGASAAATMAELGYKVKAFSFHDSPRRAHSIAAQGGINAAKNYQNDGDSVHRLFYDTVKGGDYRSREANVHRLAEVSVNIIDQATAQGVPFDARGQTGQQLLLGAYSALNRQIELGGVDMHNRKEMLDLVVKDGQTCGIITRDLLTGEVESHSAHAVVLATGGYGNIYYLSTNAMMSNVTAAWRAHRRGAFFANPCYTQIHPTCIPASDDHQSKLTLMSESLRNDGRIWVPKEFDDTRSAADIPEGERDYYLERKYPSFGNLVPRDVASRNAKTVVDEGRGVGPLKNGVFLDFADAIARDGAETIKAKYGNLFDMYANITGEDPYSRPMRIYPATHYTMGGLWVDYHLMTTVPGTYCIGEANFSDHGANRLGASALMQGLADGYFVLPYTIGDYLSDKLGDGVVPTDDPVFKAAEAEVADQTNKWLSVNGTKSPEHYHRELGKIVWDRIGMARDKNGLEKAQDEISTLEDEFKKNVRVMGDATSMNTELEKVGRVADFFELAKLKARDALVREESCGGHFRVESQTEDGEALRDDDNFSHSAAWEWHDEATEQTKHEEQLEFKHVKLSQRSYK